LVVSRTFRKGFQKRNDFYLLCDFASQDMPDLELVAKAIAVYKKRWAIEEVHCQMKQSMRWENMRLGSYQGMKNLNALMALALFFIYMSNTVFTLKRHKQLISASTLFPSRLFIMYCVPNR